MCETMADIQSATAEIRRGKKKKEEEEEYLYSQGKNIMVCPIHMATITSIHVQENDILSPPTTATSAI